MDKYIAARNLSAKCMGMAKFCKIYFVLKGII